MEKRKNTMINYVSGNEYTGQNYNTLAALGYSDDDAFVTFKQAIKIDGISGKALKGIKKAATLVRYSKHNTEIDETGKEVTKPIYFSVFDIKEVLSRRAS